MGKLSILSIALLLLLQRNVDAAIFEKEQQVKAVFEQMETDVLAFADEIERVYQNRCDIETLNQCGRSNFNDCTSTYPNQMCMDSSEMLVSACGSGSNGCNALWDKTQTAVRIPARLANGQGGNPSDDDLVESICYSRLAEPYMIKNNQDGNQMYYGSATGSLRIIPAQHSEVCGLYDPRRRPWFVAASSGPKDVVIVMDVSGSMEDYGRMELAKQSTRTIVETLTVADRVAVVAFSDIGSVVGSIRGGRGVRGLVRATRQNKDRLLDDINKLQPGGGTSFYSGFDSAFNELEYTIEQESTTGCNVAILFLTDGENTDGRNEDEVIDFVNQRTARLAQKDRQTTVFTFSLGYQADDQVMKRIACSTGGLWQKVDDMSDDLVDAMSSYYQLYALGLSSGENEHFTAWVEPYAFHIGGKMGTSVSTPVYDHSTSPPLFLGVATLDMYMNSIEEILEEDASSSTMLDRFVTRSTARCPKIDLTDLQLDGLRFVNAGSEATCTYSNVTEFQGILPERCPFISDLPNNLWENTDMAGRNYGERACCEQGSTAPSNTCAALAASLRAHSSEEVSSQIGIIVGIIVAALVVVIGIPMFFIFVNRRSETKHKKMMRQGSNVNAGMNIIMPPEAALSASAPPLNPDFCQTEATDM